MKLPTLYRYEGRWWHGGITPIGWIEGHAVTWRDYVREIVWLARNGRFCFGWNWPQLVLGAGRDWYDGPIWFLNAGIFGVSLSAS